MAFGISIQNASGTIVISEDFSNYFRVSSGTFASGGQPDFAMTGDDLLFIRPHLDGHELIQNNSRKYTSTSGYVEYVVVRKGVQFAGNFGLRIFKADGSVAFDSFGRPLLPVMTVSTTSLAATSGSAPFSTAPGRKRYVSANTVRIVGIAESGQSSFDLWIGTYVTFNSNTQFTFGGRAFGQAPKGTDFPRWGGTVIYLFCDI